MKTIIKLIFISVFINLNAQSPIITLYNSGEYGEIENAYYKDLDSIHNKYEGTWLYTNNTDTLKVKLRKRLMVYTSNHSNNFYEDELIGEYQYIENGIEKVNTLDNFMTEYEDCSDYNLYAYTLQRKNSIPKCNECADDEKRLVLAINEPSLRHLSGLRDEFILRHYVENGVEKLKVWFHFYAGNIVANKDTHELSDINSFSVPYGEYTLTKQ